MFSLSGLPNQSDSINVFRDSVLNDKAIQSKSDVNSYESCIYSKKIGFSDASAQHSTEMLSTLGFVSGLLLGPIGIIASTSIAVESHPTTKMRPSGEKEINFQCYKDGYSDKARRDNIKAALVFSTIGCLIFIPIFNAKADY